MEEKKTVVDVNIETHLREQRDKLVVFAKEMERFGFNRDGQIRAMAIKVLREVGEWSN